MKHILKIKGADVELTTDEAKQLLAELKEAFGEGPITIPMPYPVYPPREQTWEPPWTITCGEPPSMPPRPHPPLVCLDTPVMRAG